MAQKKLQRFADIKEFANVLEYPQEMGGKWHQFFHNNNPVVLELACGKGEYTVGLARLHPDTNYIGVDIKGNRIWRGAKTALDESLNNAAFLRIYQRILNGNGVVHLKTDSPHLYNFTKQVIELYNLQLIVDNDNVYAGENIAPELSIKTHYEKMDIARSNAIYYLQFAINQPLPVEKDEQLKLLEREEVAG